MFKLTEFERNTNKHDGSQNPKELLPDNVTYLSDYTYNIDSTFPDVIGILKEQFRQVEDLNIDIRKQQIFEVVKRKIEDEDQ